MTDRDLLEAYAQEGSEEAFRDLVARHAGNVRAGCQRRLGDAHLAEDAAQAVFMILARRARALGRGTVVSEWLFRTARYVSANLLRARRRRQRHEARLSALTAAPAGAVPEPGWEDVRPHLDAALDRLPARLRVPVLLHYLDGKGHGEVADELGCSRDAARMRIARGLEMLRAGLAGRGLSLSAAGLGGMLTASAGPASAELVARIAAACLGGVSAAGSAGALAEGTMRAMAWAKVKLAAAVLGTLTVAAGAGAAVLAQPGAERLQAAAAAPPAGATDVLTTDSYWRWHVTLNRPTYVEGGEEKPLKRSFKDRLNGDADQLESPRPPADWAKPEFDDSSWPRSRLSWCRRLAFGHLSTSMVCLRGRFEVRNPGGTELFLSGRYVGGLVVKLNGVEVHRADLPAGEVTPATWATPYGRRNYVDESGQPHSMRNAGLAAKATEPRLRTLGPVRLPAAALRPGVNVLAIEVHRSPYDPLAMLWYSSAKALESSPWWRHADLAEVRLATSGGGAVPNVSRPAGVQVWVQDRNDRVTAGDYADPNEKAQRLRVVAARNGTFCGQLAVGSDQALAGVQVVPGELKGPGTIPAANVAVLYGQLDWANRVFGAWSNALEESAPVQVAAGKSGAVLPVLLRVRVPADAKPGDYRGTVRVSAGGRSFDVPVELYVADWQVPDPKNYRTYIGVYQSPASVAMQYGVKPWSEEHWKLLEKSFELLGRLGNKMVNVGVADETQFGEPEGMIWWVKKPDGGYDYDFTVFDRYLGLALKHCGPQEFVCLQIWHAGGWSARPVNNKLTVQVVDVKTGQRAPMQVPLWGTSEAAAFWKPFFEQVQTRLARLGMDRAMTVGILSDSTAPDEVFRTMAAAFPGGKARWHRGCHSTNDSPKPYAVSSKLPGNEVTLHEHCYGMSMVHPDKGPPPMHSYRGYPGTAYFRVSNHENVVTLVSYRTMAEQGLYCRKQGIGRICLDFWPVLKGARGSSDIYNRYPDSSCAQREPSLKKLTWSGPAGAGTSMRFEAFCEGIQEAEAVILLSEGAASEAKVGNELAAKCRRLLVDRMWFCHGRDQHEWSYSYVHMNHQGWQELNRRSFDLAGEVARKLGR